MRRDEGYGTIEEIILYKFGYQAINLSGNDSINIVSQVVELNIYESIFSPVIKAELVVADAIGLFTNFPFTGEEIVKVTYSVEDFNRSEYFIVENVSNIEVSDDNKMSTYMIHLTSFEVWSNARQFVQKAYRGNLINCCKEIYQQYIRDDVRKILPTFPVKNIHTKNTIETDRIVIVPNLRPFAAINFLLSMVVTHDKSYNWHFYQNKNGYHIETIQDMVLPENTTNQRRKAFRNKYKYTSDELENNESYSNEGRLVTNLRFNRRHSSLQKINMGYYQNKYFEINIAQKAYNITETMTRDVDGISSHKLSTERTMAFTPIFAEEEKANRVKYFVTTHKENDFSFPVSEKKNRWGKELIETIAMGQIDITVTILGNPELNVGELFYLEVPKAHGFNTDEEDDLISGYFLITEKNDTINQKGRYVTNLRLQKDSYNTSVDKESLYNKNSDKDFFINI